MPNILHNHYKTILPAPNGLCEADFELQNDNCSIQYFSCVLKKVTHFQTCTVCFEFYCRRASGAVHITVIVNHWLGIGCKVFVPFIDMQWAATHMTISYIYHRLSKKLGRALIFIPQKQSWSAYLLSRFRSPFYGESVEMRFIWFCSVAPNRSSCLQATCWKSLLYIQQNEVITYWSVYSVSSAS